MVQISVIVPVYNAEKTIGACIESILDQSFKQFELILMDDGSTDNSGSICDEYSEKDSRIVVVHQKNTGVSQARNNGIDISIGDYISFVDSDDELLPGFFIEGLSALQKNDVFYSGYIRRNHLGSQENRISFSRQTRADQLDEESFVYLFRNNYIATCGGKIYSRELIGETKFDRNSKFGEDLKFNINLLYKNPLIFTSDKCYYQYNASDNSLTSHTDMRKCINFIDTYCLLYEYGGYRGFSKDGHYYVFVDNRLNDDLITIENMILRERSSWVSKYSRIRCLCSNRLLITRLKEPSNSYTNKYAIRPLKLVMCYLISRIRRLRYDS